MTHDVFLRRDHSRQTWGKTVGGQGRRQRRHGPAAGRGFRRDQSADAVIPDLQPPELCESVVLLLMLPGSWAALRLLELTHLPGCGVL